MPVVVDIIVPAGVQITDRTRVMSADTLAIGGALLHDGRRYTSKLSVEDQQAHRGVRHFGRAHSLELPRTQPVVVAQPLQNRFLPAVARHEKEAVLPSLEEPRFDRHARAA